MIGKLKFSFLLILCVLLLGCTKSTKEIENRKEDTNDNITDISNETTIEIEDDINKMFKKISTRSNDFSQMKKDEQLQEIANLIENMLKKNGNFMEPDYNKIAFDYINNDSIIKYRKQIQCFRHATDEALTERATFTDDQKDFLIQHGISIVTLIYNLLYRDNQ